MKFLTRDVAGVGLALGIGAGAHASSTDVTLILKDVPSWDLLGDPSNATFTADIAGALGLPAGSPITVIGVGWDLELRTVGESWLSELSMNFDDADAPGSPAGFFLIPAVGDSFPGAAAYASGSVIDLTSVGLPDLSLSQGRLGLEWFEGFDDAGDEIDGYWNGVVTVRVAEKGRIVPLPGAAGMGLAGVGLLAGVRRRR